MAKRKSSRSPFFVSDAIELDVAHLMKGVRPTETVLSMSVEASGRLIGEVKYTLGFREDRTRAWLRLDFVHLDGEAVDQIFELVSVPSKIGGARWFVIARHLDGTTRRYRKLYMAPDQLRFGSREDQGLTYGSPSTEDLYARALRTAETLGVQNFNIPPLQKPEGMSDARYDLLYRQLQKQSTRWLCAALGRDPPDFGDEDDARERERYFDAHAREHLKAMNVPAPCAKRRKVKKQ